MQRLICFGEWLVDIAFSFAEQLPKWRDQALRSSSPVFFLFRCLVLSSPCPSESPCKDLVCLIQAQGMAGLAGDISLYIRALRLQVQDDGRLSEDTCPEPDLAQCLRQRFGLGMFPLIYLNNGYSLQKRCRDLLSRHGANAQACTVNSVVAAAVQQHSGVPAYALGMFAFSYFNDLAV
ncbi:unnamed protein product [Symbiodinium natans]|uniref:Uncharacterized protein n=1 Tax=Symbiodinium natans TaxID=878477 RepID=A0A812HZU0_9DINO|nr:unnamed protein product [Symbiodinium natans]